MICVGEYEDGPFATGGNAPGQANNTPIREAAGSNDLLSANGGFGYTYAGIVGSNPSARARKARHSLRATRTSSARVSLATPLESAM